MYCEKIKIPRKTCRDFWIEFFLLKSSCELYIHCHNGLFEIPEIPATAVCEVGGATTEPVGRCNRYVHTVYIYIYLVNTHWYCGPSTMKKSVNYRVSSSVPYGMWGYVPELVRAAGFPGPAHFLPLIAPVRAVTFCAYTHSMKNDEQRMAFFKSTICSPRIYEYIYIYISVHRNN